ncbi:MAG TPA: biotin-dependent carboxyltransferase family protein [Candidatus Acidoferrales bacterium]|nr:biotin-dependent carboxyltransferase family protein [Candidatus Acidoferrales bacterium]
MSAIQVQAPGLLTTVQDLGREGFGPIGVSPSGAADPISLRLGNRLVGNVESTAGLEMTLLGGTFLFSQGAILALTGSDFGATLDGATVALGTSFEVAPGQKLRLGSTRSGARSYLCVQGGIAVSPFLGSSSTHILSGLGGFDGRPLREGDLLQIGPATKPFRKRTIGPRLSEHLSSRKILRVTPGPQVDWFSESSLGLFYEATYRVGEQSNRMGLRLEGAPVSPHGGRQMITEGVSLGAIQVPAGGSPIILFVDQQTTGGYPKIANVISADLHRVGQLRPRDEIRFEQVTFEAARSSLIEQEQLLASRESILE